MLKRAWQEKVPIACKTEKTLASLEFDFSPRQLSVDDISRVRLLIVKYICILVYWLSFSSGSGPLQCKACFARDERRCILGQSAQDCGGGFPSLGTTHCGYAKIKYSFILGGGDWVYRGCINCAGNLELKHYGF